MPLAWFARRRQQRATALEIYGRVVTGARRPTFYGADAAPDTPEGRYEVLTCHMILLLDRLQTATPDGPALSRTLAETYVVDLDDNMRELGIGDLTVPKKVRKAAGGLYDRFRAFQEITADGGADADQLAAALAARADAPASLPVMRALAPYMLAAKAELAAIPDAAILSGAFAFPAIAGDQHG